MEFFKIAPGEQTTIRFLDSPRAEPPFNYTLKPVVDCPFKDMPRGYEIVTYPMINGKPDKTQPKVIHVSEKVYRQLMALGS